MAFVTSEPHWATMSLVAFLLCGLAWIMRAHRLGQASHQWQPVQAIILNVWVDERTDDAGQSESAPRIAYRYRIRNRVFTSGRLRYGDLWSNDYAESCALIHGLHPGDELTVLVNPRQPKQVVVIPGFAGHLARDVALMVTGILAMLLI